MSKTLIVIDMQKDFIDGSLGSKEAAAIVPNVKRKINEYVKNHDTVIFTRDTHDRNYLCTNEGRHLPVVHCIKDTNGWKIPSEIDIPDRLHIDKPSFGWIYWKEVDANVHFDSIEIVGLCTDICVVSNALILKALFPDMEITVDASCCAGVTPESHAAALQTMKMCQINITGEE
jgi:nicotinamidase-related amidase